MRWLALDWTMKLGGLALCAAVMASPSPAEACSLADGLWGAFPDRGSTVPSGSTIVLQGIFDPTLQLVVDIDGQPATLVPDASVPTATFGTAYALDPMPTEGQVITLRECWVEDPATCDGADTWTWTVTAPDTTAPAAADDVEFGIYDHRDVDTAGDSCSSGEVLDTTVYVSTTIPSEDAAQAPRVAVVEIVDAADGSVLASRVLEVLAAGAELSTDVSFARDVLRDPLEEAVCVRVTVHDLAGAAAQTVEACDPHHVVADPGQEPDGEIFPPDEPDWDSFADDGLGREGCTCRADGRGTAPLWALLLPLLGLGLRRRRP